MTYDDLIQRLQDWMENDGTEFSDGLPHVVTLAEARIGKELSTDAMREQATLTLAAGATDVARPADAVAVRWLRPTTGLPIDHRTLPFMLDFWPDTSTTGTPRFYGNKDEATLYVVPPPAAETTLTCEYEARITGLSDATPTTWISTRHPDLLFYACLLEAGAFEKAPEEEQRYSALYDRALESARGEVARSRSDANSLMR